MTKKLNKPSDKSKLYLWHSKFHDYVKYRYKDFASAAKLSIGNSKYWDYLHEFVSGENHDKKSLELFIDLKKDSEIFSTVFINELMLHYDKSDYEQFDSRSVCKVIENMESIIFEKNFEYCQSLGEPDKLLQFIDYFNKTKYNIIKKDNIVSTTLNFDDTDDVKSLNQAMETKYRSIMPGIHKGFGSGGGYLPNSLVMVVAPTGVGKSLFLLQNGGNLVSQGSNHLFISVGADLTKSHIITRLLQQFTNKTETELRHHKLDQALQRFDTLEFIKKFKSTYESTGLDQALKNLRDSNVNEEDKDKFLKSFGLDQALAEFKESGFPQLFNKDNFGLLILPPDEITGGQLIDKLISEGYADKYDTFSIDYDGHFAKGNSLDMYNAGGSLYAQLTRLTAINSNIVFVGCQANKENYAKESIGLDAIAESSKKQHIVSCVITISKHDVLKNDDLQVGIVNIPKSRHGKLTKFYYLRNQYLNFKQIDKESYNNIIQSTKQHQDALVAQGDFIGFGEELQEAI